MAKAMLDCAVCSNQMWQPLEPAHADELRMAGATRLHCPTCARETYWIYSQHGLGSAPERRTPLQTPAPAEVPLSAAGAGASSLSSKMGNDRQETFRGAHNERRVGVDRRVRLRRAQRRVALQLPVKIRVSSVSSQFEEITRTVNVCRNGIYFRSERPYAKGLPAYVALNYSPHEPGSLTEQKGTVVRVDPDPGSPGIGVAVQLH